MSYSVLLVPIHHLQLYVHVHVHVPVISSTKDRQHYLPYLKKKKNFNHASVPLK